MKKAVVLGSTLWLVCGLVGCSSDARERAIKDVIGIMNGSADSVGNIRTLVKKALEEAEKAKKPLTPADLKPAENAANTTLRELGKRMQSAKLTFEANREGVTEEQRKQWAKTYQSEVQSAAERLVKSQRELNAVLRDAEAYNKQFNNTEAVAELRRVLDEVQREFESVTKQT
jgi:hypothetical protein